MTGTPKHFAATAIIVGAIALTGCSKPNAANEANFRKAIEPIVKDAFCRAIPIHPLSIGQEEKADKPFPIIITAQPAAFSGSDDASARAVLDGFAGQGLLTRKTMTVPARVLYSDDKPISTAVVSYVPTDAAGDAFRAITVRGGAGDMVSLANVCLADGKVDDIVRWTEPSDAFGQKYSTVTYRFSGTNLIPNLPTEAAATVRAPQEATVTLVQTNDGWQPPSK